MTHARTRGEDQATAQAPDRNPCGMAQPQRTEGKEDMSSGPHLHLVHQAHSGAQQSRTLVEDRIAQAHLHESHDQAPRDCAGRCPRPTQTQVQPAGTMDHETRQRQENEQEERGQEAAAAEQTATAVQPMLNGTRAELVGVGNEAMVAAKAIKVRRHLYWRRGQHQARSAPGTPRTRAAWRRTSEARGGRRV